MKSLSCSSLQSGSSALAHIWLEFVLSPPANEQQPLRKAPYKAPSEARARSQTRSKP